MGQVNVSWSGSLDTTTDPDVTIGGGLSVDAGIVPSSGQFSSGLDAIQINGWGLTSPEDLSFGEGVFPIISGIPLQPEGFFIGEGYIFVNSDYTSESNLSGAFSLTGSFDTLEMEVGSYSTSASTGDTITYEVSFSEVSPIPEVSGSAILSGILLMSAFGRRRKT